MPVGRREVALLLALAVALLAFLVAPGLSWPVSKLAAYDADGREPIYDDPVDDRALRRAGELVPDGARYYLHTPHVSPLLAGNLKAAAQLYLSPALPVRDPRAASWVLRYGGPGLPEGVRAETRIRLGPGIEVVHVHGA